MPCPGGRASPDSTQYGLPGTGPFLTDEEFPIVAGENLLGENPFLENPGSLSSAPLRRRLHRLGESASTANP